MKRFIFVLGGVRSGKSAYAVRLAKKLKEKTVFIATAVALDKEMEKRIKLHKVSRPSSWELIEEERDVASVLSKLRSKYKIVLIDCLGLLVSNLLADNLEDGQIVKQIRRLISAVQKCGRTVIVVSNEVGMGIVPASPLARRFRDVLGLANQMMAKKADEVIFMQVGIPLKIKS